MPRTDWTEELIDQLKSLNGEGLSMEAIAAEMKLSKGSVAGKLFRLGLCEKGRNIVAKKKVVPAPVAVIIEEPPTPELIAVHEPEPEEEKEMTRPPPITIPPDAPADRYAGTLAVKDGCCRWPLWNSPSEPHIYCMQVTGGLTYCTTHRRHAYTRREVTR